jgi:hypothetical protein
MTGKRMKRAWEGEGGGEGCGFRTKTTRWAEPMPRTLSFGPFTVACCIAAPLQGWSGPSELCHQRRTHRSCCARRGGLHSGALPLASSCGFEAVANISWLVLTMRALRGRIMGSVLDEEEAGRHKSPSVEPAVCSPATALRSRAASLGTVQHCATQRGTLQGSAAPARTHQSRGV